MSQDNEEGGEQTPQPEDSIKNLKSEFSRKFENVQSEIQSVIQQNQLIAQQLEQALASRSAPAAKDESEDNFDPYDPKSIKGTIEKAVNRQVQVEADKFVEQQKKQQTLSELFTEYPELRETGSEMEKAALVAFNQLSPAVRASSDGYRLAVREAAAKVGLLPASKRKAKDSGDSFTLGTGSGSSGSKAPNKPNDELSEATQFWAQALMGDKAKDKNVQERLKKRAKREKWGKWSDG
jgi:hypothetical protein